MNVLKQIYDKAKENPQKVAFPEAANEKEEDMIHQYLHLLIFMMRHIQMM